MTLFSLSYPRKGSIMLVEDGRYQIKDSKSNLTHGQLYPVHWTSLRLKELIIKDYRRPKSIRELISEIVGPGFQI